MRALSAQESLSFPFVLRANCRQLTHHGYHNVCQTGSPMHAAHEYEGVSLVTVKRLPLVTVHSFIEDASKWVQFLQLRTGLHSKHKNQILNVMQHHATAQYSTALLLLF